MKGNQWTEAQLDAVSMLRSKAEYDFQKLGLFVTATPVGIGDRKADVRIDTMSYEVGEMSDALLDALNLPFKDSEERQAFQESVTVVIHGGSREGGAEFLPFELFIAAEHQESFDRLAVTLPKLAEERLSTLVKERSGRLLTAIQGVRKGKTPQEDLLSAAIHADEQLARKGLLAGRSGSHVAKDLSVYGSLPPSGRPAKYEKILVDRVKRELAGKAGEFTKYAKSI